MDNDVHEYVSTYFTKWSANIVEHVSTNDIQICASDIAIQHMASFYGHRWKRNLGFDKWLDKLASVKPFIATEGRLPKQAAGDAEERNLGQWIAKIEHIEGGISKREQLMRREFPSAFA